MDTKEKRKVMVHVTFLRIGKISPEEETFQADVLVRARWREPEVNFHALQSEEISWEKLWNPKIYIDNSAGDVKVTASISPSGDAFITEIKRFKGTFTETMALWDYPFDIQNLSVTIMSDLPSCEVELVDDPDENHKIDTQSYIHEQEWYLYKYIVSHQKKLADQADPAAQKPALTVRTQAARRTFYFFWNFFAPMFFIACLGFLTFALDPVLPQNRLLLAFILVLTAVMFKLVRHHSLLTLAFHTYLDSYISESLGILVAVSFWHGICTTLPVEGNREGARVLYAGTELDTLILSILVAVHVVYNIQFFARILVKVCRRRSQMTRRRKQYGGKL